MMLSKVAILQKTRALHPCNHSFSVGRRAICLGFVTFVKSNAKALSTLRIKRCFALCEAKRVVLLGEGAYI